VAQARGRVLDQHLTGAGIVQVELDDLERLVEVEQYCCFGLHDGVPFG